MTDPLLHRLMNAACGFESLGEKAHDPTLTTTTCAEHARLLREAHARIAALEPALRFYAHSHHAELPDWEPPDEPNWLCPPSDIEGEEPTKPGTWTPGAPPPKRLTVHASLPWMVEDGSLARSALLGKAIDWEGDEPAPIEGEKPAHAPKMARPDTHRLVPRVPTEAMIDALDDCLADCNDSRQALILAIDAAPAP